jgi:thioesterase domain-containing protein
LFLKFGTQSSYLMVSLSDLEAYLHEHIPLSKAMEVSVTSVDLAGVILSAPLAPNINHRQSVFGGSASALAILAGWSWVHTFLGQAGIPAQIVIQSSSIDYIFPMTGTFIADCASPDPDISIRFLQNLKKSRKSRITLEVTLWEGDTEAAIFKGVYVALPLS